MRLDKLTIKARETVEKMQNIADSYGHQQIDVEHLFLSLLEQGESIITSLLEKMEVPVHRLKEDLRKELDGIEWKPSRRSVWAPGDRI